MQQLHDLVGELVRRARAARLGQQPEQTVALERRFGLVVRGARQPEQFGCLRLGSATLAHVAKHLVLHLQQVLGVEEPGRSKPRCPYGLGTRVEHPELTQTVSLGGLAHGANGYSDVKNNKPQTTSCQAAIVGVDCVCDPIRCRSKACKDLV